MTISAASTRTVVTLPSGTTSTTFTFDYLDAAHINVYYDGVLKTRNTDYTITSPSKTVFFTPALVPTETIVSIISVEPDGNPFDYTNPEEWNAENVNYQQDRLALQITQLRDESILVGPFSPSIDLNTLLEDLDEAVFDASESAIAAGVSATDAANSATLAEAWAESPTDITPGHMSAKTWAEAAAAIAIPDGSITGLKFVPSLFVLQTISLAGSGSSSFVINGLRIQYGNTNKYMYIINGNTGSSPTYTNAMTTISLAPLNFISGSAVSCTGGGTVGGNGADINKTGYLLASFYADGIVLNSINTNFTEPGFANFSCTFVGNFSA